jgi:hypothetical protein
MDLPGLNPYLDVICLELFIIVYTVNQKINRMNFGEGECLSLIFYSR